MHPRIDQLLSLRDGQPVDAATHEHAENCAVCAASLRGLTERQRSLRDLPQLEAPAIDYARIRSRALTPTRTSIAFGQRWRTVAAAAAIVAVIGGVLAIDRHTPRSQVSKDSNVVAAPDFPPDFPKAHRRLESPVAHLVEQSRELDQLLQRLPRPEVQRVSLADTVDRIEQRVQWLDMQISSVPDTAGIEQRVQWLDMQISSVPDTAANELLAQHLWRERVELMDSLVTVRYAEALPQQLYSDMPPG